MLTKQFHVIVHEKTAEVAVLAVVSLLFWVR